MKYMVFYHFFGLCTTLFWKYNFPPYISGIIKTKFTLLFKILPEKKKKALHNRNVKQTQQNNNITLWVNCWHYRVFPVSHYLVASSALFLSLRNHLDHMMNIPPIYLSINLWLYSGP
jgi:hypothetical protein